MDLLLGRAAGAVLAVALLTGCGGGAGAAPDPGTIGPDQDPAGSWVSVTGHLRTEGGPPDAPSLRWPGTITIQGRRFHETVRTDGRGGFRLRLPPGRYRLTGHSPRYGNGRYLCAAAPLTLAAGTPVEVTVGCQLR